MPVCRTTFVDKALMRIIGFIVLLPALLTVFTIHEYGHLQEMQKRGVAIEEFSLGIGPLMYQYQGKEFPISFRAIPIMAYVSPSKEGFEYLATLSVHDRISIYAAGVRNNLAVGMCMLVFFQILGYRHGRLSSREENSY